MKRDKKKVDLSTKEILRQYVLCNKYIWILAIAYFFIYVIRTAINDWSMLYLIEVKNYTNMQAGFCVCWFEVGGFLGSLAAGWSSDILFKGKRNPINVLFTVDPVLNFRLQGGPLSLAYPRWRFHLPIWILYFRPPNAHRRGCCRTLP